MKNLFLALLAFLCLQLNTFAFSDATSSHWSYPAIVSSFSHIEGDNAQEVIAFIKEMPFEDYKILPVLDKDFPSVTLGKQYFYMDLDADPIKESLRLGSAWETYLAAEIIKYAKPGSTVIDVGAHIGTHTLTLSRAVGKEGTVVAFESQPKIFRELFLNAVANSANNIHFFCAVAGNASTTDMVSIDSLHLDNVSLLKIDVEGNEELVLEGALQTIEANKPIILIEIYAGQEDIESVINKLEKLGYKVDLVYGRNYIATPKLDEALEEIEAEPSI